MKVFIELDPCKNCDFTPSICDCELEYCMQHGNQQTRDKEKYAKMEESQADFHEQEANE